ncbi:MAG: NDP-sugar synthase [Actinobacteria bacterium]|nr:NDP-sugar synthase [Actinomycetota bacterium]
MKALILAGGEGTRLLPLTLTTPKPLLPIANKPHLSHILDVLSRHMIDEAVLLTGFGAENFDGFSPPSGMSLGFAREPEPLGTAGPVKMVEDSLEDTFLVFNGDVLSGVDLSAMIAQHRSSGAVATLYLTPVPDATAFGLVPLDASGRVERFVEKPSPEEAVGGGLINAGTYVLEPSVLKRMPAGRRWSFERELFPTLLDEGQPVFGYTDDGYWIDIGTPERYLQAHWDVMEGRVPGVAVTPARGLRMSAQAIGPRVSAGNQCSVAAGARITSSVLLSGVLVAQEARIERSIIGNDVEIEVGAVLTDCIVGDRVRVGAGNQLRGARVAPGLTIPAGGVT